MAEPKKQHHAFEAEVDQLLHLVAHSLYSHKEIFLRELISNAADALDRLRFAALSDDALYEGASDLEIRIEVDEAARTLTVSDNGIGMTQSEVIRNIGTIARSGTRAFLQSLGKDQRGEVSQIGQFGVGFYSAFIVADRVTLTTRRAGKKQGVCWESDGRGGYDLSRKSSAARGTAVTLHLKKDESEFLEDFRLREIVRRYSNHTPFPIRLQSRDDQGRPSGEWETVNQAKALWTRPKKELSDEDYREFYAHVAHDPAPPLAWTHHRVEGRHEYSLLLYLPGKAPFDLGDPAQQQHGVKLYVQRVFILDEPDKLMPRYLRFVRGVVDSHDLPLNISRELLQNNRELEAIRGACVRRVLDLLEDLSANRAETYAEFWAEFGRVLKEGVIEDVGNQARILKLLRLHSTHGDSEAPSVTLDDYAGRMKEGQDKIYFLTIDSLSAARRSPHLEMFRKQGIEVLLMTDPVDEWIMDWVREYDGKPFQSVARGELDLSSEEAEESKEEAADDPLCARIQEVLGEAVETVRVSSRLTDSPSCLVRGEHDLSPAMQEIMRRQGQELPMPKRILEINPNHPLLQQMQVNEANFPEWARWILDQAVLADGGALDDPGAFVSRMNTLLAGSADQESA